MADLDFENGVIEVKMLSQIQNPSPFQAAQGFIGVAFRINEDDSAYESISMPESGFALKPTPEMRSFAGQMLHLTDANYGFASAATGAENPIGRGESENTADQSKENVTKLMMAGYDFVIDNLRKMAAGQLNERVQLFGRFEMTKGTALVKCFEHLCEYALPAFFSLLPAKRHPFLFRPVRAMNNNP